MPDSGHLDFMGWFPVAKEFKTIKQLVELLESRNVRTDADTANILRRESYYAIVNGYKDTFLDRKAMQSSAGDVYKKGTTFRQIYDLFLLDRDLRTAVFPYLIRAETILKNAVVYAFCDRNREHEAYLDRSNYATAREMLVPNGFTGNKSREHRSNLNRLMRRFVEKLDPDKGRLKPFVRHYLETYGTVPLWVLQNDLTFGNIAHFYQLQKRGVQNEACRIVLQVAGHGERIGARELLRVFEVLTDFRNICAHDDRLYCADVKGAHFDEMLNMLFRVLTIDEIGELHDSVFMLVSRYVGRVDPRALNALYTNEEDIPEEFR